VACLCSASAPRAFPHPLVVPVNAIGVIWAVTQSSASYYRILTFRISRETLHCFLQLLIRLFGRDVRSPVKAGFGHCSISDHPAGLTSL